jgi:hypothetical protein
MYKQAMWHLYDNAGYRKGTIMKKKTTKKSPSKKQQASTTLWDPAAQKAFVEQARLIEVENAKRLIDEYCAGAPVK